MLGVSLVSGAQQPKNMTRCTVTLCGDSSLVVLTDTSKNLTRAIPMSLFRTLIFSGPDTTPNPRFNSLGVGVAASGTQGRADFTDSGGSNFFILPGRGIGYSTNTALVFYVNNAAAWGILFGSSVSTLLSEQATARIAGGSANGLAIRNSANNRDNFTITDGGTAATLADGTNSIRLATTGVTGELNAGGLIESGSSGWNSLIGQPASASGGAMVGYYNTTASAYYSGLRLADTAGYGTLDLMKSGGQVRIGHDTVANCSNPCLHVYGKTTSDSTLAAGSGITFGTSATSTTSISALGPLTSTQASLYAQTISGATLQGYGGTCDVNLTNRAGTLSLCLLANTLRLEAKSTFKVDSALRASDGTVGLPAVTFATDTTLGLYRLGTAGASDTLAISANGVVQVKIAPSGILRLPALPAEGATKNAMCWDGATFNVTENAAATCTVSSARFKKNITPLSLADASRMAAALRPVQYEEREGGRKAFGIIAEQADSVDHRLASSDSKGLINSTNYEQVTVLLLRDVQGLRQEVASLRAELARLQSSKTAKRPLPKLTTRP